MADENLRTVRSPFSLVFNAKTGKLHPVSEQKLDPLNICIANDEAEETVWRGNILSVSQIYKSHDEFFSFLNGVWIILPAVLNVDFLDSPFIEQVDGVIDGIEFSWVLHSAHIPVSVTRTERQEKSVERAFTISSTIKWDVNIRVLAAMHYFHVACRLIQTAKIPGEFVAEAILNYAKSLEVLFPSSRTKGTIDAAREGLAGLGISADKIEAYYIPAIALRNKIDSAHPTLHAFRHDQLRILQFYADQTESQFRELFRKILLELENDKCFAVVEDEKTTHDNDVDNLIERMRRNLRAQRKEANSMSP